MCTAANSPSFVKEQCQKSDNSSSDIGALEQSTDAVYTWLSNNGLALNPSKSEVVKFDCRKQTTNQITTVKVAGASIQLSPAIKSLPYILAYKSTARISRPPKFLPQYEEKIQHPRISRPPFFRYNMEKKFCCMLLEITK